MEVRTAHDDFSGGAKPKRWGLWLCVLLLHIFAIMGLNAVLTLNRLAAQEDLELQAVIVPPDTPPTKPMPAAKATPKPAVVLDVPPPEVVPPEPVAIAEPTPQAEAPLPTAAVTSSPVEMASASKPIAEAQIVFHYKSPEPVRLNYQVTKGGDSAKASLTWQTPTSSSYEITYEATYFGFTAWKQTSVGQLGDTGIAPERFGDKRRGKAEQATHFDHDKHRITFSNNRPDAQMKSSAQDRISVLVQLASIFAAEPERFKTGDAIDLPVASVNESEMWVFEVQTSEKIQVPAGEMETVKLIRRQRRQYDQTVELWLSPQASYLPVRIRLTDSSGVTDQLLRSIDKP